MLVAKQLDLRQVLLEPRRLSHVLRFNRIAVHHRECAAEHAYYAAVYSYLLARHLRSQGVELNMGKLLEGAIVHHLDKSVMGDMPRSVKSRSDTVKEGLHELSEEYLAGFSERSGIDVLGPWRRSKDDSIEGDILKVADLLTVVAYLHEERTSGNAHVKPLIREVRSHLEKLKLHYTHLGDVKLQALMLLDELEG
jgi:5'-deoxynucleotidase YfbR-like HD superfamily hydrolase